jgi:hypothetical protein
MFEDVFEDLVIPEQLFEDFDEPVDDQNRPRNVEADFLEGPEQVIFIPIIPEDPEPELFEDSDSESELFEDPVYSPFFDHDDV